MDAIISSPPVATQEAFVVFLGSCFYLFSLSLALILVFTTLLWISYRIHQNAGIIDIGWSLAFLIAQMVSMIKGSGAAFNKFFLLCMVFPWAARLFVHLAVRFAHHKEDVRYQQMREKWGGDPHGVRFLLMFWGQGLLAAFISIPFYWISSEVSPLLGYGAFLGYLVWLTGFVGETMADFELVTFKQEPGSQGKTLKRGLWKYCRHPNYFFEWLVWLGIAIVALNTSWGVITLLSPLLMLFLLLRVSGIPLVEEQLIKTKGEEYRLYIKNTPSFFPWPFKKL